MGVLTQNTDKAGSDAQTRAAGVLALETELAKLQWAKVALRDPIKA